MSHSNLFDLEKMLLDPSIRKNRTELENLLADNFVEFGTSGTVYSRDSIIQALLSEQSSSVTPSNFKATELAPDVVLVTYKTDRTNSDSSKSASLRSSVWRHNDDHWQMVFHQGTRTNPSGLKSHNPNSPISIHDNFLLGYEVDASKREIILRTEYRDHGGAERTNVVFSNVEAYRFENDSFGNILSQIEEVDPAKLLQDQWSQMQSGYKAAGWPGPWAATTIDQARAHITNAKSRGFLVESSIGMSGWVFAGSMELIPLA